MVGMSHLSHHVEGSSRACYLQCVGGLPYIGAALGSSE